MSHDLEVEGIGFGKKTVTGLRVSAGETARLDVVLDPEAIRVRDIAVSVEAERGTAARMLERRRMAGASVDAVGSAEIDRSPDSDAAMVARRLTGVTVADGKHAYVRGLGDRYSKTALHGAPLPSPEPENEAVPLDLFPSDFIQSVTVQKTYTPDRPADFSGGLLEIETREFPDRFVFRVGLGTSLNDRSQFADDSPVFPGSRVGILGGANGRQLPGEVRRELGGLDGDRVPRDPEVRRRLGLSFPREFSPRTATPPLARDLELSVGDRVEFFGRELGYLLDLEHGISHSFRDDEIERSWRASAFDPSLSEETRREPNVEYAFTRGTRTVSWGAHGNLTFLISPTDKVGLKTMLNRDGEDEARTFVGANRTDLGGLIRDERLRYVSRTLGWGQLFGEHETILGSRLEWRATLARGRREEPGLREALYRKSFAAAPEDPFYLENVGESGRYFFSDLIDDDLNGGLDWRVPFALGGRDAFLKTGASYRRRSRDFSARRFKWEFFSGTVTDLDEALRDDAIVGRLTRPGEFVLGDVVEPGDRYDLLDRRAAGYAMADLPAGPIRATLGARVESYDMELVPRARTTTRLSRVDVLPALNLRYDPRENMVVRAAASRTADRPEFRELSPFQFTEATSLRQLFGNPELDVAGIVNLDLRWEWFPRSGELISASGFYKRIDDPIEQVYIATGSSAYSFQNGDRARLLGVELDLRKRLGFLGSGFENVTARGNLALVDSEVRVSRGGIYNPTNLRRPLEGQSPYVVNAGLSYGSPGGSTDLGLFYHVFGSRIAAAGGSDVPDIYERPRHDVALTFGQDLSAIGRGLRLRLEAANLLDAKHRFEQSANGVTRLQREFRDGRTFSAGLSYRP